MARVAIEFDAQQIFIAAMQPTGRRVLLKHLSCVKHEPSAEAATNALTEEITKAGLAKSDTVVVITRSDVELRLLDVPPAPENELPAMVKFVAKNEFASLNDNWLLDFVRLSGDDKEAGKVLAAGLSPERQNSIQKTVEAAGLRLKQIAFRPFSIANYLSISNQLSNDASGVLVECDDNNANISMFNGRSMFATRTIRLVGSDLAKTLEREIKRTAAVATGETGADQLGGILLLGDPKTATPLGVSLSEAFSQQHQVIDPANDRVYGSHLRSVDQNHRYVPLLGALANEQANSVAGIDFLSPRKVVVQKADYSKWYLYGGIAAACLLLMFAFGYWQLASQSSKIAKKEERLEQITRLNNGDTGRPAVKQTMKQVAEIDDWVVDGINWQDTLLAYSEHALTADDAIVDKLTARQKGSTQMTVTARIVNENVLGNLTNELEKRTEFITTRKGSKQLENNREFSVESKFEIELKRHPQEKLRQIDKRAETFLSELRAARAAGAKTTPTSN